MKYRKLYLQSPISTRSEVQLLASMHNRPISAHRQIALVQNISPPPPTLLPTNVYTPINLQGGAAINECNLVPTIQLPTPTQFQFPSPDIDENSIINDNDLRPKSSFVVLRVLECHKLLMVWMVT